MVLKIHKNDEVIILTGKDKGRRGKVKHVLPLNKVIVSGVNIVRKHQKSAPSLNKPGGFIEKELAIQISNVAIFNIETGMPDRVGFLIKKGKKFRFFKSTNKIIE